MHHNAAKPVSFETDVKPLFTERDRRSMAFAFDLWSYEDVSANVDAILVRLRDGTMPCDRGWPAVHIDTFERWIASGQSR